MAPLQLFLFGDFELRTADGTVVALRGDRLRSLLTYLALRAGRPVRRERVAALFWSDSELAQSRNSLRQTLFALRRALGAQADCLAADADSLAVRPALVSVDALQFDRMRKRGNLPDLQAAAALYRGALLQGLRLRDTPFSEWLAAERARYHAAATDIMTRLLAAGDKTDGTDQLARHLLKIEPSTEVAHRALMQIHATRGQRHAALRQYHLCRTALAEDGTVPSSETRALYAAIREGHSALAARRERTPATHAYRPRSAEPGTLTIALGAFAGLGQTPAAAWFASALTASLTTTLSQFQDLCLISPDAAERPPERYDLDGSVQVEGSHIEVFTRLVDRPSGRLCWADRFRQDWQDGIQLQDRAARAIAVGLQAHLIDGPQAYCWSRGARDHDSWRLLTGARALLRRLGRSDISGARQLCGRTIEREPSSALAWTLLGEADLLDIWEGYVLPPASSIDRALDGIHRALALDPELFAAQATLSAVLLTQRCYDGAIAAADRAVALAPEAADTHHMRSVALTNAGECLEGLQAARTAVDLVPRPAASYLHWLARAYLGLERADAALLVARDCTRLWPRYAAGHLIRAWAASEQGRLREARRAAAQIRDLHPMFGIERETQTELYRDPRTLRRMTDAWRAAGLPACGVS